MPFSAIPRQHREPRLRISPRLARTLVVCVGISVAVVDFLTPPDYGVALFYGLGLALCAWAASRRFLWVTTGIFVLCVLLGAALGTPAESQFVTILNRVMTCVALALIAALVDRWVVNLGALDAQRAMTDRLLQTLDLAQILIRKQDGTVLFWSRGAEELYGWSADEAVGKVTHELFATRFSTPLQELNDALARNGEAAAELLHRRKDGRPIWVASHWTMQEGLFEFPVVTEVNNDITELKLAENRFRNLTEALPQLVWQVSPTGETTYVNRNWRKYFAREPGDISIETIRGFMHPEDVPGSAHRWKRAFATGEMQPWQARYRRHDGAYRWFVGHAVPVRDEAGKILYWLCTATDVHEERAVAERLRETQKLESIGRLAGGVAHDFNNLLTAISGYTNLLMDEVSGDAVALAYGREVEKAAERAAGLTKQLLAFSRPQLAQPRPVNLNTTISEIQKIIARVIGEDIEIVVTPAPRLPNILADPVQLDQVVMNLAINARDAMPEGGALHIETGTTTVDEKSARERDVRAGEFVVLRVRDTGTGMDAVTKARLFEPFFTTKEIGKGTGLGLSIVYGIVQHAGGFIDVESAPGAGAAFYLCFPASTQSERMDPAAGPGESAGRGETILVVEDEDAVRHLVSSALRKRGYNVIEAPRPAAAIRLSADYHGAIDLLITDVLMPEMRGPDLARAIRGSRPDIRVLYMSGYTDSTFLEPGALDGAAYLQKPFAARQLAEIVTQALAGKRHA